MSNVLLFSCSIEWIREPQRRHVACTIFTLWKNLCNNKGADGHPKKKLKLFRKPKSERAMFSVSQDRFARDYEKSRRGGRDNTVMILRHRLRTGKWYRKTYDCFLHPKSVVDFTKHVSRTSPQNFAACNKKWKGIKFAKLCRLKGGTSRSYSFIASLEDQLQWVQ